MTDIAHPPGRHVTVRGHRLWVESEGEGPPLVVLAGLGPAGSHVVFHPFLAPLADTATLYYVDLHGRGRSDHPTDLSTITFADDVADIAALVGELGAGPVDLYGFSYGGLVAQALALDHPGVVRRVVLANTLYGPEMWQRNHENINRELDHQFPEVWDRILELRRSGVASTDPAMQELFGVHARLIRFHDPDNVALLPSEPGARNTALYPLFVGTDVDFVIGGQLSRVPDFRARLPELAAPPMVLAGRYDRALYPRLQRGFVEADPRIELHILERSGSFSHIEEPDTVIDLVRAFLR
jgi:pimeloyl-ACP methyl ester carboxylesterase